MTKDTELWIKETVFYVAATACALAAESWWAIAAMGCGFISGGLNRVRKLKAPV